MNTTVIKEKAILIVVFIVILGFITIVHEYSHVLGASMFGHQTTIKWNSLFDAKTQPIDSGIVPLVDSIFYYSMPYFTAIILIAGSYVLLRLGYGIVANCLLLSIALMAFMDLLITIIYVINKQICNDICPLLVRTNYSVIAVLIGAFVYATNIIIPLWLCRELLKQYIISFIEKIKTRFSYHMTAKAR